MTGFALFALLCTTVVCASCIGYEFGWRAGWLHKGEDE